MRIKRSEILRAIRQEPLKFGDWIHGLEEDENDPFTNVTYNKNCKVCAVGAVLRQKGVKDEDINGRACEFLMSYNMPPPNEQGNELDALESKLYLTALSIKFEKLARRLGHGKRTREQLAKFVKANFPKQFNVSI